MNFKKIANFLFEIGTLRKLPRAHRQTLLTADVTDNISSHSYRVAITGYLLAKAAGADAAKVVMMCLFHDTPEARSGDQNWVHKKYVKVFEDEIIKDQLTDLVPDNEILKIMDEYCERKTLEATIAKDADLIEQNLLLREHANSGNEEAKVWLKGAEQGKRLSTQVAKDLLKEISHTKTHDWWKDLWTSERR
jgi:putative hydrolase of HD superfamily